MPTPVSVSLQSLQRVVERHASGFEAACTASAAPVPLRAELAAARRKLAAQGTQALFASEDDRMVSLMQAYLSRHGTQHGAELMQSPAGYEAKFDNLDPGWLWSLTEWIKGLHPHPFIAPSAAPESVTNDYCIAVLADWGTGLFGAPVCANSIAASKILPQLLLHLGDIYYAGDDDEVQERFLAHWPQVAGASSRALNGNHEMYTGGNAYFKRLLADLRFQQGASCFAQRNEHWLLLHLDTAYTDHDLHGDQAQWALTLAAQHPAHRVILFSHHQPFSAFEGQGPKLQHKLAQLLGSGRVAAWYWGHEHSCVRYDMHPGWKMHGRCVGHSGFPYFRFLGNGQPNRTEWVPFAAKNDIPGGVVLDGPNPYVEGHEQAYGPNGYLTLQLHGRAVHETYHAADGSVLAEFDIGAAR